MTVSVRVYESVDHAEPGERFYARAIAMQKVKGRDKPRETTSVGFYAETANEARNKACAWIEAERKRLADIGLRREEAAQSRRKPVPHELEARS